MCQPPERGRHREPGSDPLEGRRELHAHWGYERREGWRLCEEAGAALRVPLSPPYSSLRERGIPVGTQKTPLNTP